MKIFLKNLLEKTFTSITELRAHPFDLESIVIERTRQQSHGDFSCNIAMVLAKQLGTNPRQLAEKIIAVIPKSDLVEKIELAGPGFINFFLAPAAYHQVVQNIIEQGDNYGFSKIGKGKKILLEYVSANPTGPLHVGHGRGAAYGATLATLLETVGYQVSREYYVNDAGRQMDILATSIWLRYLDLCGEKFAFPANGYQGDYIWDVAATLHRENNDAYQHGVTAVFQNVPADEPAGGDKEKHIDGLIANAKKLLGENIYRQVLDTGLDAILGDIRKDLQEFGVVYDEWFRERTLVDSGALKHGIERLKNTGHTFEKAGALWFRSTDFGDEKDRVLIRENGAPTYFASDIAYHVNKLERGYDQLIDIWGADHHGYVPRVKAVLAALGEAAEKLDVALVQFAVLYQNGKKMQMSTRSGEFVTLRELRQEVGNDAARFFYVMRKSEQHMDFDLDLAKSQSNDNPVYYIQYAHARICSVFRQLKEKRLSFDIKQNDLDFNFLNEGHERDLMVTLSKYPELIENAAQSHDPHHVGHYLRDLANDFHTYYNAHTFITDDAKIRDARLALISTVRQVIKNGLTILGVSVPESM